MDNCVFCNFNDKSVAIYEDKLCYAVISLNPINKYHVLVIPRAHYENFVDLPDEIASHIFLVAKKLSLAVRKACNPLAIHHISDDDINKSDYNLVAHYKLHIIPRFKDDGVKMEWNREDLDINTRSKLAEEVKKQLIAS